MPPRGAHRDASRALNLIPSSHALSTEQDWKLLAIRTDDPLAASLGDVESPGTPDAVKRQMDAIRTWFRVYKVPEGTCLVHPHHPPIQPPPLGTHANTARRSLVWASPCCGLAAHSGRPMACGGGGRASDSELCPRRRPASSTGKGENSFAFEGRWLGLDTTLAIVESTHAQWRALLAAPPTGKKAPWTPAPPLGAAANASANASFAGVDASSRVDGLGL